MDKSIADDALLERACHLKWAFNAKPDMVIRVAPNRAVCIEMKLESGVGKYPSTSLDRAVFKARGLAPVLQTDVQRYLMVDLLGFETSFILLCTAPGEDRGAHRTLTWSTLFRALDLGGTPAFVRRTISAVLERA